VSVQHVIVGDPSHGVTRLALQLTSGRARTRIDALSAPSDATAARRRLPPLEEAPALHLHLTDDLLGPDPVAALRRRVDGRRVAITFHDVPQEREGEDRRRRRGRVYRELADAADLVVASSDHERDGLRRLGVRVDHVLPLPVDGRLVPPAPAAEPTVGVLGWIHPGKGHDVLAAALATLDRPTTLVAIGAVVPGHERWVAQLQDGCRDAGVGWRACGYLDDRALLREAARVGVPVAPHRHVSASGSIGSWLSAGRRPIVVDGGYVRELEARMPGALWRTDDLADAVARALQDPASTVLPDDLAIGPDTAEAARAQQAVLDAWAGTTTEPVA
jgi:glycosyltransferase involved in cell wall biosynthesis